MSTTASEVFEGEFELAEPVVAGVAVLECVAAVKAYWACGWSDADVKLEQGLGWPVAPFLLKGNDFSIACKSISCAVQVLGDLSPASR